MTGRGATWIVGAMLVLGGCAGDDGTDTGETMADGSGTDTDAETDPSGASQSGPNTTPGTGDGDSSGGTPSTSGSTSADDGTDTTGDDTTTTTGEACVMGETIASEVVMIGDSYLAITSVPQELYGHARSAGALAEDETYRRYDQGGTQMGNGQIPGQFDQAVGEDPVITTVIMTGGGNDVLIGDANGCLQNPPPGDPNCVAAIDVVMDAAEQLLIDMADAGVEDVVYFFYPHLPDWGFIQGAKTETLDYAYPLVEALCDSAPLNCVFVDTRDAFAGHENEYFMFDGVHPNGAGSTVIAQLVWDAMVDNCVAQ